MPIKRPDTYEHSNPNNAIADSDGVRGGGRKVDDLAALYGLSVKSDQLKEHVTKVYVVSEEKEFKLIDAANIGNSTGWEEYTTGGSGSGYVSVDVVYYSPTQDLPTDTSTAIATKTIVDGDRVLVALALDTNTINKVYTASVDGTTITWSLFLDLTALSTDVSQPIFVKSGAEQTSAGYKNTVLMWNGASLVHLRPLPDLPDSLGPHAKIIANPQVSTSGFQWISEHLASVHRYYATNDEALTDNFFNVGNVGDSAIIIDIATAVFITPSNNVVLELSSTNKFSVFCHKRMSIFKHNGIGLTEYPLIPVEPNDKGNYANEAAILVDYPNSIGDPEDRRGWYVTNEETDTIWKWDVDTNAWVDTDSVVPVVDNLNSTSTSSALSANMGKTLNESKAEKPINDASFTDATDSETLTYSNDASNLLYKEYKKRNIPSGVNPVFTIDGDGQQEMVLILKSGGNNQLVTFTNVTWASSVTPTIDDSTSGLYHKFRFYTYDGGTTYIGEYELQEV